MVVRQVKTTNLDYNVSSTTTPEGVEEKRDARSWEKRGREEEKVKKEGEVKKKGPWLE